jgi:predicted  nucleic acid-binding Zn-ribbon protein
MPKPKKVKTFIEKDSVLLKIHRIYGKNEAFLEVFRKMEQMDAELKLVKFRNGELASELAELNHEYEKLSVKKSNIKQYDKDEVVAKLKDEVRIANQRSHKLQKEVVEWRNQFFSEAAKRKDIGNLK